MLLSKRKRVHKKPNLYDISEINKLASSLATNQKKQIQMKKMLILLASLFAIACATKPQGDAPAADSAQHAQTLNADQLLDTMPAMVNKPVTFSGTVVHVCKHGGKKLHIVGTDGEKRILVMSSDASGVFSQELEGSDVVVQGTIKETRIDAASLLEREQEFLANHKGEEKTEAYQEEMAYIEKMREDVKNSEKGYISKFKIEAQHVSAKQ